MQQLNLRKDNLALVPYQLSSKYCPNQQYKQPNDQDKRRQIASASSPRSFVRPLHRLVSRLFTGLQGTEGY
jgi:hypothetical protein